MTLGLRAFHPAEGLDDQTPEMPNLDLPYTDEFGVNYPSYMDYLRANALVISGNLELEYGQPVPLQASGNGSISMDSTGRPVKCSPPHTSGLSG